MTGLVERARNYASNLGGDPKDYLVWQLADEIERLRSVGNAAFCAMCEYRDNRDEEVFQDAIDELGSALREPKL